MYYAFMAGRVWVMGVICLVALVASSCSWAGATRAPDKWTPDEPITCDISRTGIFLDFVVAPVMGSVVTALYIVDGPTSDGDPDIEGSVIVASLATVATLITWSSGFTGLVWRSTCKEAMRRAKRREWLQAQPGAKPEPALPPEPNQKPIKPYLF